MQPLLQLEQAAFGYDKRAVVSGVDLRVDAGAFIGIVGPNGAGKTTLFRGILGLVPTLAGRVERNVREIGYVPQREALDPIFPLRVDEVVFMGAYGRLAGWRSLAAADRQLAEGSLARVGMLERAREPFAALSGGQRQRVLIARALMVRPRLLLLDEPTSGVDRSAEQQILGLLRELNRTSGIAVMLVSHQLAMVRTAVDACLWVAGGKVVHGRAAELLAPENLALLFSASDAPQPER